MGEDKCYPHFQLRAYVEISTLPKFINHAEGHSPLRTTIYLNKLIWSLNNRNHDGM